MLEMMNILIQRMKVMIVAMNPWPYPPKARDCDLPPEKWSTRRKSRCSSPGLLTAIRPVMLPLVAAAPLAMSKKRNREKV